MGEVPPGWELRPIGDVLTLQRGFDITKATQRPGDVPVVSSGGIGSFHDTAVASGPGVIIGRKGTLGKVFFVEGDYWPHDTTLWVKDFKGSEPRFVYYFFQTLGLERHDVGSSNPTLNRNHVHPLVVPWPHRAEQKAIAEVLGALDDKIAVNASIARTTLSLGRALLEQELRTSGVPVRLGDVIDLVYGKALPVPDRREGGVPVFGCTGQVGWHDTALTDAAYPVVGRKGANAGHVSWLPRPGWVIDTAFYARPVRGEVTGEALYFILDAARLGTLIADSAVPGVNRNAVLGHRARVPGPGRTEQFARQATALLTAREQTVDENRTLAALRDTLLPRLLTGRLRVKDAARTVEEAV